MTGVRISVTAEHIAKAGDWPKSTVPGPDGWKNPVELAIAERAGEGIAVDVDDDDDHWIVAIGTRQSSTLVVDLPPEAKERLDFSWAHGVPMEPFEFSIELDDWLVGMVHEALHS